MTEVPKLETYYAWRLSEYPRMPGTANWKYSNLAPFILNGYATHFVDQALGMDINSPEFSPWVIIYTSGPGNGKTEAEEATLQLARRNAYFLTHPADGSRPSINDEIRVAGWDYRFSLLRAINEGRMERNRDRYHTQEDYDRVLNPTLWEDTQRLLDFRKDKKRANHIVVLEIPRSTGNQRTGPVLEKLAELDKAGQIKAQVVFSQGNPVVRQLGLIKRMAIQGTLNMSLGEAKFIFWAWGLNRPRSETEKRRRAEDGAPFSQLKSWNDDIDEGVALWAVENKVPMPFLKGRVFDNVDDFNNEILTPPWYDLKRYENEIRDTILDSGRFGNTRMGPLMFRDLAVGMEADFTLRPLFGDGLLVVYDAPPVSHLLESTARGRHRIEMREVLQIIRGMGWAHGMRISRYIDFLREHGTAYLDQAFTENG